MKISVYTGFSAPRDWTPGGHLAHVTIKPIKCAYLSSIGDTTAVTRITLASLHFDDGALVGAFAEVCNARSGYMWF